MVQHISKGYIYFAMAFSFTVELLKQLLLQTQRRKMNKKAERWTSTVKCMEHSN